MLMSVSPIVIVLLEKEEGQVNNLSVRVEKSSFMLYLLPKFTNIEGKSWFCVEMSIDINLVALIVKCYVTNE